MKKITHYPTYDVMNERDQWDGHTQSIVASRLVRDRQYSFLTTVEAEILRAWCSLLMNDDRGEVIQYVLSHIDKTLSQSIGEGQRKSGVPKAQVLVREGLKAIQEAARMSDSQAFFHLEEAKQKQLMGAISEGSWPHTELWEGIPQKELFQKLMTMTVEAYYSHPTIWSEIGYGGPAYPRGYVRGQIGQLDPWEAKREL